MSQAQMKQIVFGAIGAYLLMLVAKQTNLPGLS